MIAERSRLVEASSRGSWGAMVLPLARSCWRRAVLRPDGPGEARAATEYLTLTGDDPYHTSVLVSRAGFAPGVDGLVVANGDDYMAATCSAVLGCRVRGAGAADAGGLAGPEDTRRDMEAGSGPHLRRGD